jgi:hypothetical protein
MHAPELSVKQSHARRSHTKVKSGCLTCKWVPLLPDSAQQNYSNHPLQNSSSEVR